MSKIEAINSYVSGNLGTYDVMGQGGIDFLESITAAEKGMAVPYVEMWELDRRTGLPLHGTGPKPKYPLTAWTVAPPAFGSEIEFTAELRERPPISLESITIKTVNPLGLILYRQLDIKFIVHRPDVLAADPSSERDNWSALITPGSLIAMEYGWSANEKYVKNPILNGEDADGVSSDGRQWVVHGRKIIRFAVTNYRFILLPDQQIQITVSAIEDGDFGTRHTYVVPNVRPRPNPNDANKLIGWNEEKFQSDFSKQAKAVQEEFKKKLNDPTVKIQNKSAHMVVRLEDIFRIFFVEKVEQAIKDLGYQNVTFSMGCCNERCPNPLPKHYWNPGKRTEKLTYYIGDFTIPLQDVIDSMSQKVADGTELTVFNFITPFLRILGDPTVWSNQDNQDVTMPDVQMRFVPKRNRDGTHDAHIFVIDNKTELMRFGQTDFDQYQDFAERNSRSASNIANRDEIRKICRKKGIPYIEMMKGNSWIQDAQFDVIQDELMQAIFINRYFRKDRHDITKTEEQIRDETFDHRKTLYSSAIKGQITAIGNHGMDVMGLYWIDFGVPQWSGPFRLTERSDIIDQSGWQTTLQFISDGSDPLGSQGRSLTQAQRIARAQRANEFGAGD